MLKQFFLVVELLFFRVCIVYVLVGKVFLFSPIFIFLFFFFSIVQDLTFWDLLLFVSSLLLFCCRFGLNFD